MSDISTGRQLRAARILPGLTQKTIGSSQRRAATAAHAGTRGQSAMMITQATPADGKRVWDSMLKAGIKPTVRTVTTALNQAGLVTTKTSVHRWRKGNWAPNTPNTPTQGPAMQTAAQNVDAAVPVLTGDPTTRAADLTNGPERAEFQKLDDGAVIRTAAREACITAIILLRQVRAMAELVETMPLEIGVLQQALASSISASTAAFKTMLAITDKLRHATPAATGSTPPDPVNDRLNLAMAAYEKAEKLYR
jgi:hypothetical protein